MVAVVNLSTVWFNLAADPSVRLEAQSTNGLQRVKQVDGRVQRVAGGGARFIRRAGAHRTWAVTLPWPTRAEVEWLDDHAGETVTVRDHRGHKVHAVYASVPVSESGATTRGRDVQLQLLEVTHSEAV